MTSMLLGASLAITAVGSAAVPAVAARDQGNVTPATREDVSSATKRQRRGLNYRGLTKRRSGPCRGMYQLNVPGKKPLCTAGPDPAPRGVDISEPRSLRELRAAVAGSRTSLGTSSAAASVACVGDGKSGHRVQAIYAVASTATDRYGQIAPLIRKIAAVMDEYVVQSAAKTGGERQIRWVTKADCTLDVKRVVVSPNAVGSFDTLITELKQKGFKNAGRKYHVWVDQSYAYCGIATAEIDNRPWSWNYSNVNVGYARTDEGCWFSVDWSPQSSELHEVFHTLGAVQRTAPNASYAGHCTDEWDVMCYDDGSGLPMTYTCPESHDALLDCHDDDYFSSAPPSGSWLAGHWNTADSLFLTGSLTQPPSGLSGVGARGASSSAIRLSWNDAPGEESYSIRCREGDSFVLCKGGIAAGQTAAKIGGLAQLKWYDFKVCVHGVGGRSCSGVVSARTLPKTLVIDDKSKGFSRTGRAWYKSNSGYNGRSYWASARRGKKTVSATWKATLKYRGTYEILAKIPRKNANTSAAKYKIVTPAKTTKRKRDQFRFRGKWVSLGEHELEFKGLVKLSNSTGERLPWQVAFDAVKFVPIDVEVPGDPGSSQADGSSTPTRRQAVEPPTADAGGPYEVKEGERVRLDARGSSDTDGTIAAYLWSRAKRLDDATSKRPWLSMAEDGVRIITLTVADDEGATDTAEARIRVRNAAPVAQVDPPVGAILAGREFLLGGITFSDTGSLDTHTVLIDWGDGISTDATVTETGVSGSASASHIYSDPGPVTVRVVVSDDDGDRHTVRLDLLVEPGEAGAG